MQKDKNVPKKRRKKSKMLDGTVKRCALKKYVTLIHRIIRSRVMAETPKLIKTRFWFIIIKGQIFNIFKNGKKLHTIQLHNFLVYRLQKSRIKSAILPHFGTFLLFRPYMYFNINVHLRALIIIYWRVIAPGPTL